jgi:hypothetical protein
MTYYIMAIGPYDESFIGPFTHEEEANAFYDEAVIKFQSLDFYGPIDEAEAQRNLVEFGPAKFQSPSTFIEE